MIITESDLHAYNNGELGPEAVRQLEDDPLALQDATRLRALSEALRDEAPISIVGRAETLERLRGRSSPRIGVPGWVWGVGAACVFGLVFITIPKETRPEVVFKEALYSTQASAPESRGPLRDSSGAEATAASPASPPGLARNGAIFGSDAEPQKQATGSPRFKEVGGIDIARTAALDLRVDDTAYARAQAESATRRLGGFVADSSLTRPNDQPVASLTLRVPSPRLDRLVSEVRALGSLASESSSTEDVTAGRIDSEARLATMLAEERQLRELLSRSRNVGEVLRVRERLTEVRSEIESLQGSLKSLRSRVQMATLNATLTQRPKVDAPALEDGWPRDSVGGAVNTFRALGRRTATAGIYIGVFAPLWLPVLIFAYLRFRRR